MFLYTWLYCGAQLALTVQEASAEHLERFREEKAEVEKAEN